jgi:8-oxo-dGTP diphosphatase
MSEGRFSIGAYGVIQNEHGQVLLTRRREGGEWVLPGGTVEDEEAPWDALVREVAEETGLDVGVRRLLGVYAKRQERDLVLVFAADVTGGRIRPSDERDRIEFVDPHHLPERTAARDRERIADALSGAPPVFAVQPSAGDEPPQGTR